MSAYIIPLTLYALMACAGNNLLFLFYLNLKFYKKRKDFLHESQDLSFCKAQIPFYATVFTVRIEHFFALLCLLPTDSLLNNRDNNGYKCGD
jgi:hypothetical protein